MSRWSDEDRRIKRTAIKKISGGCAGKDRTKRHTVFLFQPPRVIGAKDGAAREQRAEDPDADTGCPDPGKVTRAEIQSRDQERSERDHGLFLPHSVRDQKDRESEDPVLKPPRGRLDRAAPKRDASIKSGFQTALYWIAITRASGLQTPRTFSKKTCTSGM